MDFNKEYDCKGKLKNFFTGETEEVNKFTMVKGTSVRSPITIIDFGKASIVFADPKEVIDKYDKESIIDETEDFVLYCTYNKKLMKKFFKKIGYKEN